MMRRLLVLSGGHPYDADGFAALLDALDGWEVDHRLHPEAEDDAPAAFERADAVLFYDMAGYAFGGGRVTSRPPSEPFRTAVERWFLSGGGAVAMHHALAGWSAWPAWARMLGGRFLYAADGHTLDSGYRHDVRYEAVVVDPAHPVVAGVPPRFALVDELYLVEIDEAGVTPLLRADHRFVRDGFYSAAHAVAGRMFDNADWPHPPGSDLIAWERSVGAGRLVYLQPGDGPRAYADRHFRRLLANALDRVAA